MLQDLSKGAVQAGQAVDIARRLESALEALGATGKGLHEKVGSIEGRLPAALVTKLRFIASVRNKIVHEDELLPEDDMAAFVEAGQQAGDALGALGPARKAAKGRAQGKGRKRANSPRTPAPEGNRLARTVAAVRLIAALLLAGAVLVFLLILLGNDGAALWAGAFAVFFILGGYFLWKLRRPSADAG